MPDKHKNRARILEALADGNFTRVQLKQRIHIGDATISRWIAALLKDKTIHVCNRVMNETRNKILDVYALGPAPAGLVVKDPPVLGYLGRSRLYRKRIRASGEYEDYLARQRAQYWRKKAGATPPADPLFSLFK